MDLMFAFQGDQLDRVLVAAAGTTNSASRYLREHLRTPSAEPGQEDTEMSEVGDDVDSDDAVTVKKEDGDATPTPLAAPNYDDEGTPTLNTHEMSQAQVTTPRPEMTPGRTTGRGLDELITPFPEDPEALAAWYRRHPDYALGFSNPVDFDMESMAGSMAKADLSKNEGNATPRASSAQIIEDGNTLRLWSKYPFLSGVASYVLSDIEETQLLWVRGDRVSTFKGLANDGILHRGSTALILYRHDDSGIPVEQIRIPLCTEGDDEAGIWIPYQSDEYNNINYNRCFSEKKPAWLVPNPSIRPSQSRKMCSRCGFVASLAWRYGSNKSQCQSCGLSREGPHRVDKRAFARPRKGKSATGPSDD